MRRAPALILPILLVALWMMAEFRVEEAPIDEQIRRSVNLEFEGVSARFDPRVKTVVRVSVPEAGPALPSGVSVEGVGLGYSLAQVRETLGEPVSISGDEFEYGHFVVRFREGVVVAVHGGKSVTVDGKPLARSFDGEEVLNRLGEPSKEPYSCFVPPVSELYYRIQGGSLITQVFNEVEGVPEKYQGKLYSFALLDESLSIQRLRRY